jgi:GTP-binding protein
MDAADEQVRENYDIIAEELSLYREELADRTQILVLNKIDLVSDTELRELEIYFQQFNQNVMSISNHTGDGIDLLKEKIAETLEKRTEK